MSIDPEIATTNQPYVFTNDNPLNSVDPLGLVYFDIGNIDEGGSAPANFGAGGEGGSGESGGGGGDAKGESPKGAGDDPKTIGDPKSFNPESLRGDTAKEVGERIPSDWKVKGSKSGGGTIYQDPANPGRQIRVMPGYDEGTRGDPLKEGPYAAVSQNGVVTYVPLAGNPILSVPIPRNPILK